MIKNLKWLCLVSLTIMACASDDDAGADAIVYTSGSADFSKFVTVGNSLTAGYTDGALYIKGQENAYPNIMAQQFSLAGGGEFTTPYMSDNLGGMLFNGVQILENRLFFNGSGPQRLPGTPTTELTNTLSGPFNNMGVPGAKSFHLAFPGYAALNPYYGRMATSASATVIGDAVSQSPTFFSLWIGNNDVLSYATNGGDGVNQLGNLNPATYGNNDITDPNVFASVYSGLLDQLTANGAKGAVANIPYVTSIPYFTTVPYNPVPLDAPTAGLLNGAYAAYNNGLLFAAGNGLISSDEVSRRTITFQAGAGNAVVIEDEYLTNLSSFGIPSYRQATAEDLVILPASTFIGTVVGGNPQLINGLSVPLADRWVLTKNEIQEVKVAVDAYNASIQSLASAKGLAFVDANALLNQIATTGIQSDGFILRGNLVFGNAFSLDGVHPTSRGYAFIANKFIEAVNATYGSNLPKVNIGNYNNLYPAQM